MPLKVLEERKVAVAGMGAIGGQVARELLRGGIPGLRLAAVSARDTEKARKNLGENGCDILIVSLGELASHADIVLEAIPAALFDDVAVPAVERGCTLIVLSAGALLERGGLITRAAETGARIIVPSGAILGLDALRAASEGMIESVSIVTRKPPQSLAGAPYLVANRIDVSDLASPIKVFSGPVQKAIRHFPANVNVAAAVSLAGIGPERTTIEVWADPGVERNSHTVSVISDCSTFTMTIESVPSPGNPRTSLMAAQSAIATLRRLTADIVVGT